MLALSLSDEKEYQRQNAAIVAVQSTFSATQNVSKRRAASTEAKARSKKGLCASLLSPHLVFFFRFHTRACALCAGAKRKRIESEDDDEEDESEAEEEFEEACDSEADSDSKEVDEDEDEVVHAADTRHLRSKPHPKKRRGTASPLAPVAKSKPQHRRRRKRA
jgi:hypothetical protein